MIVSLRSLSSAVWLAPVLRTSLALVLVLLLSQAVQAQSPAFWRAIETNDINTLRTELMRGANPNARHPEHGPAIVAAARFKAFDVVRVLASLNATDVDAASVADENALMLVATLGDRRSFDALLQRGAQVNRPGWTPLHYAASGGHLELVKALIEQHAFIDAQSPNNTTPLMMAARMRALPVVQYLIDQGADPSLRNQAGLDAAAYLERSGERQWAIWMNERAQRYVARYGTVEQPRWTATESGDGGAAGGAQADLAPVQMNREVSVAPDTRRPETRPPEARPPEARPPEARPQSAGGPSTAGANVSGQGASASRPAVASQPAPPQGGGTAATSAKPTTASAAKPAAQGASGAVAPSQSPQSAVPKPAAPPVLSAPSATSPIQPASRAPASPPPPAASAPAAPAPTPSAAIKPVPPIPPAASRPVAPASTVSPGEAAASQPPRDSEPLFFSRTLSIPADPPAVAPSR